MVDWVERLNADAQLTALLGGEHIYPASASRPVRVPSMEWILLYDTEDEWTNPIGVQWDFWARGIRVAGLIEKRLRLLSHADYGQELGGERLWLRYRDGRSLEYPKEPGVVHRALDFEVEPVRSKYTSLGA